MEGCVVGQACPFPEPTDKTKGSCLLMDRLRKWHAAGGGRAVMFPQRRSFFMG